MHGSLRYSETLHRIASVSQKMLTQTLRNLERDGLLTWTLTPSVPVRTDSTRSRRSGTRCWTRFARLKEWAEEHMPEVDDVWASYDERNKE